MKNQQLYKKPNRVRQDSPNKLHFLEIKREKIFT